MVQVLHFRGTFLAPNGDPQKCQTLLETGTCPEWMGRGPFCRLAAYSTATVAAYANLS